MFVLLPEYKFSKVQLFVNRQNCILQYKTNNYKPKLKEEKQLVHVTKAPDIHGKERSLLQKHPSALSLN